LKIRFALCLWIAVLGTVPAHAEIAGKVISLQGKAEVKKTGTAPWMPAANQQQLEGGDTIRTLALSRAVVLLADETQLKLNASTTLELRSVRQSSNLLTRVVASNLSQGSQSLLNLAGGQVWLRSKLKPADVRINTPAVTAAIRGTEFDIKVAEDGESVLTMLEGVVDFRNDQGSITVSSGEQARCRIGQAPTKSVILRPRDAVQWVLYYPGAISPADYPSLGQTPEQLKSTLAGAAERRKSAPGDAANLLLLARAQRDLGQRKDAEETLKSLVAASPQDMEARTDLGWLYLEERRTREALEMLKEAGSKSERAATALAIAQYQAGDAEAFFNTIHSVDPSKSTQAATQRAFSELLYGNAVEARRLLEAIPAGDPSYSIGQGLLSNVLLAQNEKDEALKAAQRAVQAGPRSPSAYLNLSLCQQSFFQIGDALQSARQALELDPEFVTAQVQVARLLFAMGDTGEAEKIARAGLAKNNAEAALNSLLGFVLLAQAKTGEARIFFEKSIAQDGTRGEPHLGLGIASMRRGQTTDATQSILIASTLEPQLAIYQSYLAKAFYDLRRFDMAFEALGNATALDPKDPTPHLYAGIFHNDLSRPANAVRELTKSIELNNNRAVYRSRFLLDEDLATRNVNLATAYNRLYLSEWGNYEAVKSQISDAANSSTHIFLGQTFLNLRGRTQAAGSELLLARLLLPVNANSFNAFNDYTTLFEMPRLNWTLQGQVGSFNRTGAAIIASGGSRRFAYGLQGTYNKTDGFRPVNDDRLSFDGIAQFKFALTPHSDMLVLYSHGQQNAGDIAPGTIGTKNNKDLRVFDRRNRAEIGYHVQVRPGSDVIAYFSGEKFENVSDDPRFFNRLYGEYYLFGLRSESRKPDLNLQLTHLYKVGPLMLRYGIDMFEGRIRNRRTEPCCLPLFDQNYGEAVERQDISFRSEYVHADYSIGKKLVLTGAVRHDWASDNNLDNDPEKDPSIPIDKWNPQAGFFYTPFDSTSLRFAFIRSMQTNTRDRILPTNIHGFVIGQNDPVLSQNESYSFGYDQRIGRSSFFRGSAFYRDRDTPILKETDTGYIPSTALHHFHGADLVWNQILGDRWSLVPMYAIDRAEDAGGIRHENYASTKLFYISPKRFWLSLGENWIRQTGDRGGSKVRSNFATTDFNAAYELPRKIGLISFEIINMWDHPFTLLIDPLSIDQRVPRRQMTLSIKFNL
jgi:tetratricopeptide (TPR) repeat protein